MIKLNKLCKSTLVFVIMVLFSHQGWTQNGRSASGSADSKTVQKEVSAVVALKNFVPDNSNPILNDLRLLIIKAKVDLEYRQSQNQLSTQEIADRKEIILAMENKVNVVMEQNRANVIAGKAYKERKFTRAQFASMTEPDQMEIAANSDRYEITDLVSSNPGAKSGENVAYITVDDFKNSDVLKQIHIIKNYSSFIIVQDASEIPDNETSQEKPVITKYKISRAELNFLTPEKRKSVENSKDFIITEYK